MVLFFLCEVQCLPQCPIILRVQVFHLFVDVNSEAIISFSYNCEWDYFLYISSCGYYSILMCQISLQFAFSFIMNYFINSINSVEFFLKTIYYYSVTIVCMFSPSLHPTPASATSLSHLHPPPWFCPCVLHIAPIDPSPHYPLPTPLWLLLQCS